MPDGAVSYQKFLDGDRTGMEELVEQFRDGLILYLNTYVNDLTEAEDLAEDVFVELVVKKPRFRGRSSFRTWLYAIARHRAVDRVRKLARRREVPEEAAGQARAEDALFAAHFAEKENAAAVHRALGRIRPEYRQVLYLSFFEDFSNAEIAESLRKTRRQVENLIYRAKQALRAELEKEGIADEIV